MRRLPDRPALLRWFRLLILHAAGALAGAALSALHVPLPYMLGALAVSGLTALSLGRVHVPIAGRVTGQVLVAGSVGLTFTPDALAALPALAPAMLALALGTIAAAFLSGAVLARLARGDRVTCILASVPLGPVEAATLAQRAGLDARQVVFAQTLRILALVVIIPPALIWLDGRIDDPSAALRATPWTAEGALLLVAIAFAGGFLFRAMRLSNPFFLGPLAAALAASLADLPVTALPYPLLAAAQVLLGTWLGAVFDRAFFRSAGRFLPAAVASTLVMMSLCALMAVALVPFTGLRWTVMVLAAAPGSVTEMALAAKVLQEGVAIVTAFHIARIFLIIPFAPLILRLARRIARR